jgi:hypothetical protein
MQIVVGEGCETRNILGLSRSRRRQVTQLKKAIDSQPFKRRIASKWSEVVKSRVIWTVDGENEAAFKWSPVALSIGHLAFFVSFPALKAVRYW